MSSNSQNDSSKPNSNKVEKSEASKPNKIPPAKPDQKINTNTDTASFSKHEEK